MPSRSDNSILRRSYLGLGSNVRSPVGNPAETITAAISCISRLGELLATSSLYQTEPVGIHDQPTFTNAALVLRTRLTPDTLLDALLQIERDFGRDRSATPPKGPRSLDLDVLMVDDLIITSPLLTLPHPALAERRFVLTPLAEIAPELIHPVFGCSIAALLDRLPDEGENRQEAVRIVQPALVPEKP